MKTTKEHLIFVTSALTLALAPCYGAYADESEKEAEIESIVVTSQFREQRVQDVPLAITAVNAALLEERNQTNISDIANQAPSVTLKPVHAGGGPAMSANIRGIGQNDFTPALEPGVGIYVDDVYIPTLTGAMLELVDLERVEILRGPQGTLTGRNSIGGAIKLISREPSGEDSGYFELKLGEGNLVGLRGSADVSLSDNLFMRVSGVSKRQDGYVDVIDYGCAFPDSGINSYVGAGGDCLRDKFGEVGYDAGRIMLKYVPNDRMNVLFAADLVREDHSRIGEVLRAANLNLPNVYPVGTTIPFDSRFICGDFCNYSSPSTEATTWVGGTYDGRQLGANGGNEDTTFDSQTYSAKVNYDLTDTAYLTSITAYREFSTRSSKDGDLSPANVQAETRGMEHHFFSQEFRLNNDLSDNLQSTVGLYYSDQKTLNLGNVDLRYIPVFPGQFLEKDPVDLKTQAAFATLMWDISDSINLTTGLRYTTEDKTIEIYRVNPTNPNDGLADVPGLGAANGEVGNYSANELDYRISLSKRWSESLMTYATVSTGYKGGGINPRAFFAEQVTSFDSETSTVYELGFKSDLVDNSVRLNGATYFNNYKNYQVSLQSCPGFGPDRPDGSPFAGGPCAMFVNIGDVEIIGAELELAADLTDELSIDASLSYIDFKIKTINPAYIDAISPDAVAPFMPETKWSIGAQYLNEIGENGSVSVRVDASYQDDIYTSLSNSPGSFLESYTIANAKVTWRNKSDDLAIALAITNLTDKYYDLTSFAFASAGAVLATPARPRELSLSFTKRFE
jgi:iron complex outermembrane recepter protein